MRSGTEQIRSPTGVLLKVSAHPLVVAAALGLLNPVVLADDEHPESPEPQAAEVASTGSVLLGEAETVLVRRTVDPLDVEHAARAFALARTKV